jgi:purine-nucleoside phosphorylase
MMFSYSSFLKSHSLATPEMHIVLGSGFGSALDAISWKMEAELSFREIEGFPSSTVPDHAGKFRFYSNGKKIYCFQMGRIHGYEGHSAKTVASTVMAGRLAGVQNFLLTNASGGLSAAHHPGDIMLIRDQVNLTGQNPLMGENPSFQNKELGPRFPDMSALYDPSWRVKLNKHCSNQGLRVHEGVYLGVLGPSFETPAEVQLFSSWGIGAVGMSTVWEAIALKHSGAKVAGISLISNLAAGMGEGNLDHLKILETCRSSASKIIRSIEEFAGDL